jgi:hypothetical protein
LTPLASASSVRSADWIAALAESVGKGFAALDFGVAMLRSDMKGNASPS